MKRNSKNSRNFDAVQFNSSRLGGRKELKLSVQRCLSDKSAAAELAKKRCPSPPSARVDMRRSPSPPLRDRQSSPLPIERVVRSTSPSNFHSSRGHVRPIQEKRSVSPKACRLEKNGRGIVVHHYNKRRSSSPPPADHASRKISMNGRVQHMIQEKRSVSPVAHAHSTERRSSPPPAEPVSRITTENFRPFRQRSVSPNACRLEKNGRGIVVHHHNKRRSSSPPADHVSRKISMNGRVQHMIQEKRSVSPVAHAHSTERRSSPPPAEPVSRRTTENFRPFRQRSKKIQGKGSASPDLNAKMHLPTPYSGHVLSSPPNGEAVLDETSIDAKMRILPSFLGKVKSLSQSAQINDEITIVSTNAPMSSKSTNRTSSAMVEAASASIARVQHFMKDRARSRYMTNAGKNRTAWHVKEHIPNFLLGRSMKMREPEDKVKDITTLDKQASMPQSSETRNEQSVPSADLQIDSLRSKEIELEKEEERPPSSSTRLIASITSASTENMFQQVRSNQSLCQVAYFDQQKQSELVMTVGEDEEPREEQMTREFVILGLDEEEDIDGMLPSLTSEYLGISLSMDSTLDGLKTLIPLASAWANETFTTNDERGNLSTVTSAESKRPSFSCNHAGNQNGLLKIQCNQEAVAGSMDESSGVFAKVMKMMDMKGFVSSDCQRPYFTMPEMKNEGNNMQQANYACWDPIREESHSNDDDSCATIDDEVSSTIDTSLDGLLKIQCNQEAVTGSMDESSGVSAKVMKMMDMKGFVSSNCQQPYFTMPKMKNEGNNMQQANYACLDPFREESHSNDDDSCATTDDEVSSTIDMSLDDFTEYDLGEGCIYFNHELFP